MSEKEEMDEYLRWEEPREAERAQERAEKAERQAARPRKMGLTVRRFSPQS